jgi:hypothetical protein
MPNKEKEHSMKLRLGRWILPVLFALIPLSAYAGGRPEIIQINSQFLDNVVNINVHWQSPNPVILLKVMAGKEQQEIKIDEHANKRNRLGFSGEATVTLNAEPRQGIDFITYVVYLQDDLKQISAQRSGKVKVPQAPAIAQPFPPQPPIQMGVQTGVQVGVQVGPPPGNLPGQPSGTTGGSWGPQGGSNIPQQTGSQVGGQPGDGASQTPGNITSTASTAMETSDAPPYLQNLKLNRLQGNTVSISIEAIDDKGLKEITFRIFDAAGNQVQNQTVSNLEKVWQGSSQAFQLSAGKYLAVVQAVDTAGNTSQEQSVTFDIN